MNFIFSQSVIPNRLAVWRFFWPVLLLAYGMRVAFAQWADVPLHSDEIHQYTEQAYRLIHGYGLTPWEYVFGIRSWFIPLCLAGLLLIADLLGLDQPHEYIFFLKSVLCLVSLSLPVGMYRLGQLLWNEQAATFSFLLGCFWHHFLYVAHKPMPGVLAMYGLVWLVVWMLQPASRARAFWFGLLLGVVFTLRYQLVPVLGIFWLVALYRLRGVAVGPLLAGNAIALSLAGALDWYFWGGFLSSFIDNFRLNFLYDIASTFGVHETLYYVKRLTAETGGLIALGAIGALMLWPRIWPIILGLGLGFLAFHIPAHKELRFVIWLLPFAMVGVAVVASWLAARAPWLAVTTPAVLCVWVLGISSVYSARYAGLTPWKPLLRNSADVMHALGRADDVTAVDFLTPSAPWWNTPAYHVIGKPVPLYMWGWHSGVSAAERTARLAHVSHIVAEPGQPVPEGYVQIGQYGALGLWQSNVPKPAPGLDGFGLRASYPAPIPRDYKTFGSRTPLMIEGW
ncbi:MAG: hypothetical protein AAFU86_00275 [Pseudomonadota bacterium]